MLALAPVESRQAARSDLGPSGLSGLREPAWAPDGRADEALMRAMRTGINLTVETRAANGARFRDVYQLRGAASAIDAAALACLPPR